jgi:hypothetical protein
VTYAGRCYGGPWDGLCYANHLPTKELLAPGPISLGQYRHDATEKWLWESNDVPNVFEKNLNGFLNGVCHGGPLHGKGLTHDKPVKAFVATNTGGWDGEYRYNDEMQDWRWKTSSQVELDALGWGGSDVKEKPMSRLAEEQVEMQIREGGKTAPRITPEIIDQRIRQVKYYRFPDSTLMICAIELMNGYHVVGEAGCSSPMTFDETIAKRIAFDDARRKIWALEGYVLRNVLKGM